MPTESPFLTQGAVYKISNGTDTGGLVATANKEDLGLATNSALVPTVGPPSSSTAYNAHLIPVPGFIQGPNQHYTAAVSGASTVLSPVNPTSGDYNPWLQCSTAGETPSTSFTQSSLNSALTGMAICYIVTTSWDAAAKIMTQRVEPDSGTAYNMGNGSDVALSLSTPAASGDFIVGQLASMSTDFWFTMGSTGTYALSTNNVAEGLVSIKIETL